MIMLNGYVFPSKGERFKTKPIYINPLHICYMNGHDMPAERFENGTYSKERVDVTSIAFSVAYSEGQATVEVIETPENILAALHYWGMPTDGK